MTTLYQWLDLSVFYSLLYIFPHPGIKGGERGAGGSAGGCSAIGGSKEGGERLYVSFYIRNAIHTVNVFVTIQCFISIISTLIFLLNACFSHVVTFVALSKSSCVAYG